MRNKKKTFLVNKGDIAKADSIWRSNIKTAKWDTAGMSIKGIKTVSCDVLIPLGKCAFEFIIC